MRTLREFMWFLKEEEEQQKESFSFEELGKYVGRDQRLGYLHRSLTTIDYGSSRGVFSLPGDRTVLKAALNEKGEVQNETEYKLFHQAPPHAKLALAAIKEPHDPGFEWIVMEKVQHVDDEALAAKLGFPPELMSDFFDTCSRHDTVQKVKDDIEERIAGLERYLHHKDWKGMPRVNPQVQQKVENYKRLLAFSSDLANLCLAMAHLENNSDDVSRANQLGINSQGHLVLLDYGFGVTAFHMYNPSIYQQVRDQERSYMDMDDNEEYLYQQKKFDKYGNEIKQKAPRVTTQPALRSSPVPNEDDDVPF